MGDDAAVAQAARVSYGEGTKKVSDDRQLIRYLMRHRHTTPFEMAELKFLVRVPMDCWRQWIRHRAASTNEYSTRYSVAIDSAQTTDQDKWREQASGNRQGSDGNVDRWPEGWGDERLPGQETPGAYLSAREHLSQSLARDVYEERLKFGVAREQARKDLPLSTYTEAYWKIDLHNLFHFLGLRMEAHAQEEIRTYATTIGEQIVAPLFPECYRAFLDYRLGAITLSLTDQRVLQQVVQRMGGEGAFVLEDLLPEEWRGEKCRERDEFRCKLTALGILANI